MKVHAGARGGERPRERERLSSRLSAECEALQGAWSQDPEIMTWAKTKSQMLNWLCHRGCPIYLFKKDFFFFFFLEREYVQAWTGWWGGPVGGGTGREIERGREADSPECGAHCEVLDPRILRSWPEPKPRVGGLTNWATQVPQFIHVKPFFFFFFF